MNTEKTRNQRSEPQYFIGRDEEEQREKAGRRQAYKHVMSWSLSEYKKKSNDQLSSKTTKDGTIKTTMSQGSPLGLRSWLGDKHFLQSMRRLGFHLQQHMGWQKCPALSNRNGVGNSDRINKDLSHREFKGSDVVDDGNNEDTG